MLIHEGLPFIKKYVDSLNEVIKEHNRNAVLSKSQKKWLGFVLLGIIVTNVINWRLFSRISVGRLKVSAISWMFRQSKIDWELSFQMSVRNLIQRYGIVNCILNTDDTDKKRSKSAKKIFGLHKFKDKTTGGYSNGQELVMLQLVTPKITFTVGFEFYNPDPVLSKWKKEDDRLKKKGIPKKDRPKEPKRDPRYPKKSDIALKLIENFMKYHKGIRIQAVTADNIYGTAEFMDKASEITGGAQVISKLQYSQNIKFKGKKKSVQSYFHPSHHVRRMVKMRGGKSVDIFVNSARLYVDSHKKKRFVIALKYNDEKSYRYLVATDMTWRTDDIIHAYSIRWLIEVFFQDHKTYEGWGKLTKHTGMDGSYRSLTLSLLVDHCLFFHPNQLTPKKSNLPAKTVGSLCESIKVESLLAFIRTILMKDDPVKEFDKISQVLKEQFKPNKSKKHMNDENWGDFKPSPFLGHKATA